MSVDTLLAPRLQTILGDYQIGGADALGDVSYHLRAQDARRSLAARMQGLDREHVSKLQGGPPYFVSRKVDGEFTVLVYREGQAFTVNPGGTVRRGLPVLDEAAYILARQQVRSAVILGELHFRRTDRRTRIHDLLRVVKQPESAAELDSIAFAVFDLVEVDGAPPAPRYGEVLSQIEKLFAQGTLITPVETHVLNSHEEIEALFDRWVGGEGAEGVVVRRDGIEIAKIKPRHTLDVAVLGFTEGQDDRAGMLHDMLVGVMRPEGLLQVLGRVGGGFTEQERRDWLSDLKDECAESEYIEVNDQLPYQLVRPERVVEISCLDLLDQNTRGASIDRMVLDFDSPANTYRSVRRLPLCSPISPQFVRAREDKSINPTDIRLKQITDLIEVPLADRDASALVLPASEILVRNCYTKVLKGQVMVRKILLWKTNKEKLDPDYPAFVAYVTDFSPNRAEAMKREVRVSNSERQIQEILQALTEQYVVRGWEQAS